MKNRFVVVSAPSLVKLAEELNAMVIGGGHIVTVVKTGKRCEALVDLFTIDEILYADIDEDVSSIALSA